MRSYQKGRHFLRAFLPSRRTIGGYVLNRCQLEQISNDFLSTLFRQKHLLVLVRPARLNVAEKCRIELREAIRMRFDEYGT